MECNRIVNENNGHFMELYVGAILLALSLGENLHILSLNKGRSCHLWMFVRPPSLKDTKMPVSYPAKGASLPWLISACGAPI
jgi:hypothetical protein